MISEYRGAANGDDSLIWNVWETQGLYQSQYGRMVAGYFDIFLMLARFSGNYCSIPPKSMIIQSRYFKKLWTHVGRFSRPTVSAAMLIC